MQKRIILYFVCFGFLSSGCQPKETTQPKADIEYWKGAVHTDRVDIPFRFRFLDSALLLINNDERIELALSGKNQDSASYSFPFYDAELIVYLPIGNRISGNWKSFSRKFKLPFSATLYEPASSEKNDSLYAQINFLSPDSSQSFPAIGAFSINTDRVSGTFLTETGDYRYMEGSRQGDSFDLSTFDGDHLYFAKAKVDSDNNISGKFYSANNPPYTWSGFITDNPTLTPSDEITAISRQDSALYFTAHTLNGDSVNFGPQKFYGSVSVVSVFGSWCPNCHDELRMYSELVNELNNNSLLIVPVAFERQETAEEAAPAVLRVINGIGAPFEAFYAGRASKSFASSHFDGVGEIKAFPTSVIIDKRGKIRKVYSGFSGPGTGHYYQEHKKEVSELLSRLLAE